MSKKDLSAANTSSFRDPRFFRLKAKNHKVKVDSRFKSLFEGSTKTKGVKTKGVDKYGRKQDADSEAKDLKGFYKLSSDEEEEEEEEDELEEFSDVEDAEKQIAGEQSYSDEDSSEDEEEYLMDKVMSEHPLVNQQVPVGEATRRIALVNMDWDQMRATDIYVVLHGFKPLTGAIRSIKILPSEFGRERLRQESLQGPQISKIKMESGSEEEEKDVKRSIVEENKRLEAEERGYNDLEVRKYQLERLKYYFALVECDSRETAAAIYAKCDGLEFEKSANVLDLRYVPEEVQFEEADMREYCDKLPLPGEYRGKPMMVTQALHNTKTKITWDGDDVERRQALKPVPTKRKGQMDWKEADLAAYLASASSEDDEGDVEEYKRRLLGEEEDVFGSKGKMERGKEMQVSFTSAFDVDQDMDREMTFEVKAPTKKSKLLEDSEEDETTPPSGMSKTKQAKEKKQKRKKQKIAIDNTLSTILLPEKGAERGEQPVDVDDPRFQAMFESAEYALDPTHKSFKRTPAVQAILQKKRKMHSQSK